MNENNNKHKAGFVSIIGSPNVGKSTLMNQLVGEKLSIITSKQQTTRHRIMGIVNDENYQIVYSDTPGFLNPKYKLHEGMMHFVNTALQDADFVLFVTDIFEEEVNHPETLEKIKKIEQPVLVLINKIDIDKKDVLESKINFWHEQLPNAEILPISALHAMHTDFILNKIVEYLPESPPFFAKDQLTDKPIRFFVSEIIREKIFNHYRKEVPYSTEVIIEQYKESSKIDHINAIIIVGRQTQKGIIIGHQGKKLKQIGTEARLEIEQFLGKKVFLQLYVKVDKDWRFDEKKLKGYGYMS